MSRRNRLTIVAATASWVLTLAAISAAAEVQFRTDAANEISFPAATAKYVRLVILQAANGQPCIDELEVYADGGKENLALASRGAKATASSSLSGYTIHKIEHLNDGRYGNAFSWIAAGRTDEWAQIELSEPAKVAKVIFSRDREGRYRDRMPQSIEVRLSLDGHSWQTVSRVQATIAGGKTNPLARKQPAYVPPYELSPSPTWEELLRYAFLCERHTWQRMSKTDHLSPLVTDRPALPDGEPYWGRIARLDPLERTLVQMEELLGRLVAKGLDVAAEREQLAALRREAAELASHKPADKQAEESLYVAARAAKRAAMFRDPDLAPLERILFVKRHPYRPSHNYSDILDSQFRSGGGVCVLEIPRPGGRLEPQQARLVTLFDASRGIARDAVADFDARRVWFAYRPEKPEAEGRDVYWHLMEAGADGSGLRQLTDGPFHDYYPCPLPDGGLAFISTRCRCRFLCWRPQAFVLFRMDADGQDMRPLSFANLSEWAPGVMRDGRILWTRSEYQDKGADFGHTLWAIRPDGTHPELVFGNNTPNCYMNGREVPGTREISCTLISHGGDLNGPIGLIDPARGPFAPQAVTNITPDVTPHYNMSWARQECFRDPVPVCRDYFLTSHAPADRFGLYVIDRWGNRELVYLDPAMGSMCPTLLRPEPRGPAIPHDAALAVDADYGRFSVAAVYQGLEPLVPRGKVKYLRVCQEVRSGLEQLPNGEYRKDHNPFTDFYATPIHKVSGPFGWPSYVAKASLGVVPVEADGSVSFDAPAGKVLYFQLLDQDYNELQRMRSVVQLQPGEQRSCIGCHENRRQAAPPRPGTALRAPPRQLEPEPWGSEPFAYEKAVQPVLDRHCVRCHDATDKQGLNLAGTLDPDRIPASYRTLIAGGWVHHFNWRYQLRHSKAEPLSFGTLQSKLWQVLDRGHHDVKLPRDEMRAVKCWIDLNCPLWPDYRFRLDRPAQAQQVTTR